MRNVFEQYEDTPNALRLGKWLEELIAPSVKALLYAPEAEQQRIVAGRSWRGE